MNITTLLAALLAGLGSLGLHFTSISGGPLGYSPFEVVGGGPTTGPIQPSNVTGGGPVGAPQPSSVAGGGPSGGPAQPSNVMGGGPLGSPRP
jgi:hypothetical protein